MKSNPRNNASRNASAIPRLKRGCLRSAAVCAIWLVVSINAQAEEPCGVCKPAGCCEGVAYTCCPVYKREKIERKGFEVKCEPICVPRVRLPWQDPCTPRTARVIYVHRLESATRECGEKCVLTWEPRPVCSRCGKPASTSPAPAGCTLSER